MRVGVSQSKLDTGAKHFCHSHMQLFQLFFFSRIVWTCLLLMPEKWMGLFFLFSTSIENRERDLLRTVVTARSSLDLLSKLTGSTSREIWSSAGRAVRQGESLAPIGRAWSCDQHHLWAPIWLGMVKVVNSKSLWPCLYLLSWPRRHATAATSF